MGNIVSFLFLFSAFGLASVYRPPCFKESWSSNLSKPTPAPSANSRRNSEKPRRTPRPGFNGNRVKNRNGPCALSFDQPGGHRFQGAHRPPVRSINRPIGWSATDIRWCVPPMRFQRQCPRVFLCDSFRLRCFVWGRVCEHGRTFLFFTLIPARLEFVGVFCSFWFGQRGVETGRENVARKPAQLETYSLCRPLKIPCQKFSLQYKIITKYDA